MFILHHSEDTDRWKPYIVAVTFQGHPRSKVMVPTERLYACSYLWIIVTICLTGTVSKILALFYKKKSLLRSHVTRNALDDPKSSAVFCAWFYRIFWSKPEVSIFKNGWDMANPINFMFCNITWPEMHRLTPEFKFFIRNLYATKMQSIINLGRKIIFLKFYDVTVTLKVIWDQMSRCQMKAPLWLPI